jgi:UDP-sulfoquinovose synthase
MKIFIAGIDGYLGWPLAIHLTKQGHKVQGIDSLFRRNWVSSIGFDSAIPILGLRERTKVFEGVLGDMLVVTQGDLKHPSIAAHAIESFKPDAVVHLGEMPSAPFSMMGVDHAVLTQTNNIVGTLNLLFAMKDHCPDAHLVKLGSMGEYGTPNLDIPEGDFGIEFRGRKDELPFPRQAGSWYHQSKVHDSNNIMLACKLWGLRSTDVMQGIVYGTQVDAMGVDSRLATRFDFDECFGTVINRFCAQAVIEHPLTVYGSGEQCRGFLSLQDSINCLTLALENPPETGEYRVFNQFENVYAVSDIAGKVMRAAKHFDLDVRIDAIENPREEEEGHYYNPDHKKLFDLGYKPTMDMDDELIVILNDLIHHKDRIEEFSDALKPEIKWIS